MSGKKYSDTNLYELLGVDWEATEFEIRKAYRKKALECHPDKNPDNPKAAELFHELSRVLAILTDTSARAAFDKVLRSKKANELRNKQLDSKRQKLKAELEKRERDATRTFLRAQPYPLVPKTDEEIFQEQVERLRCESSKLLEEEYELMRQQLRQRIDVAAKQHHKAETAFDSSQHRIKIKWKAANDDPTNGGYSEEIMTNFLKKYGEIVAFAMSTKKGSALVELKTLEAGEMAIAYEKGLLSNPLKLEWIKPPTSKQKADSQPAGLDLETLVLRKLRQAEERQRLIEQMQKEDEVTPS